MEFLRNQINKFHNFLRCKSFYFLDFIQDKTKIRSIIPFSVIFILYAFISSIFQSIPLSASVPTSLMIILKPSLRLDIGNYFERPPILKVLDQYSYPMKGIEIYFILTDLKNYVHNQKINCDYQYLSTNQWNYNYFRNIGPCSIELNGSKIESDVNGYASFDDLVFLKAPEGYITFNFQIVNKLKTKQYYTVLSPLATDIIIKTRCPDYAEINVPLNPQPILVIFNKYGNPIGNKKVDAISYPYGDYQQVVPQFFDPDVDKFAILWNSCSNFSNGQGVASFDNLKILASTHLSVYIIFIVDGAGAFVPWQKRYPPTLNNMPIVYMKPIKIKYKMSHKITLLQTIPNNVIEGTMFSPQPIIKITDEFENPTKEIICFALLKAFNGNYFPLGFQPTNYNVQSKFLKSPITGLFLCKNMSVNCFQPVGTNASGIIKFNQLSISQYGQMLESSSVASIQFNCGNSISDLQNITIVTSVKYIEFLSVPHYINFDSPSTVYINAFEFSIKVMDKDRKPIPKKFINNMSFLDLNKMESPNIKIKNYFYFNSLFYNDNTNMLGIMKCDAVVYFGNFYNEEFLLQVNIDGIENISSYKTYISYPYFYDSLCASVELLTPLDNQLISLKDNDSINISFKIYDLYKTENQLFNNNFTLTFSEKYFLLASYSHLDISLLYYQMLIISQTISINNNNIINFINFNFTNFFSGTYYIYILSPDFRYLSAYQGYSFCSCSLIAPLHINYTNTISEIELYYNKTIYNTNQEISLKNEFNFEISLKLLNKFKFPVINFFVSLDILIYEYDPSYFYDSLLTKNTSILINIDPFQETSDLNGMINSIKLYLNKSYYGTWMIAILVNGISTIPLNINLIPTISQISLIYYPNITHSLNLMQHLPLPIILKVTPEIENTVIISYFEDLENQSNYDISDLNSSNSVWNSNRLNRSNNSGIVIFSNLSVLSFDNSRNVDSKCINGSFYFKAKGILDVVSQKTSQYTFCYNFQMLVESSHNMRFPFYNTLTIPIDLSFNFDYQYYIYEALFPLQFSIRLSRYHNSNYNGNNSTILSSHILHLHVCYMRNRESISSDCNILIESFQSTKNYVFHIIFSYLYWNELTQVESFDLIYCYYDFCDYSTNSLSGMSIDNFEFEISFFDLLPTNISLEMEIPTYLSLEVNSGSDYLVYGYFHCNINSQLANKEMSSNIIGLFQLLNSDDNLVDAYNYLSENTGVKLNETLAEGVSSIVSTSLIIFQINSGASGNYVIQCQGGNSPILVSNQFFLFNEISKIMIINSLNVYETSVRFIEISGIYLPLNVSFFSDILIKIYKNDNCTLLLNLSDKIEIDIQLQTESTESIGFNDELIDSTLYQIKLFWNVLISGGNYLFSTNNPTKIKYDIYKIEQIDDYYVIQGLKMELYIPGLYLIQFKCKGITSLNDIKFKVIQVFYSNPLEFIVYYQNYVFIFTVFILWFTNSISAPKFLASSSLIFLGFDIYCMFNANLGLFASIFGYFLISCLIFTVCLQYILIFLYNENSYFSKDKEKKFIEYTQLKIYSLYRIKKPREILNSSPIDFSNKFFINSNNINQELRQKQKNINNNLNHPIIKRIKKFFLMFQYFKTNDCFYFPQRIILAIFVSLFTLIYCIVQIISYSSQIEYLLKLIKTNIQNVIYNFINLLLNAFQLKLCLEIRKTDINFLNNFLNIFSNTINGFVDSFSTSLIISNIIISALFIFSFAILLKEFHRKAKKRKKINIMNKTSIPIRFNDISEASSFCGLMMGSTVLSYIVVTFLLTIIVCILISRITWIIIWEYKSYLLLLIIPIIIEVLLELLMNFLIYENKIYIRNRMILQIHELIILFLSIISGFGSSFQRFLLGLIGLFVGLIRVDKSIVPKWIKMCLLKDSLNKSFKSVVSVYRIYNNPIVVSAVKLLEDKFKKIKYPGKKLWLMFSLQKFTFLRQNRKKIKNILSQVSQGKNRNDNLN